jgi:thioredoxin-related protein
MKNNYRWALATVAMWAGAGIAQAADAGWSTDFEAAKLQAAAEHKDLLIDFTGSDWCSWCQKLDKEVFQQEAFAKAKEKYVLVELDYPRDESKQTGALHAQNQSLARTYPVSGYPTILLCDATGAPYAATGYEPGGPEKYLDNLNTLQAQKAARDEAFDKAAKAEGVEKAKQLIAGMEATKLDDDMIASTYLGIGSQIKKADPKDETGFAAKEAEGVKLASFQQKLGEKQGNFDGTLKMIAETLADPGTKGEFRQMVHGYEAATYAYANKRPEAIAVLEKAVAEDPQGKRTDELKEFIVTLQKEKVTKDATPDNETTEPAKDGKAGE